MLVTRAAAGVTWSAQATAPSTAETFRMFVSSSCRRYFSPDEDGSSLLPICRSTLISKLPSVEGNLALAHSVSPRCLSARWRADGAQDQDVGMTPEARLLDGSFTDTF